MVSGGIFKKKSGFTAVQNEVARDPELSMKAKGIYLVINSYITMPDKTWGKSDFYSKVCEGTKAFDSAWDELKEKGYLKVRMYSDGRSWYTELELLDVKEKGAHTFYYNRAGDLTHTNLTKPKANNIQKDVDNSENLRTPKKWG